LSVTALKEVILSVVRVAMASADSVGVDLEPDEKGSPTGEPIVDVNPKGEMHWVMVLLPVALPSR